MKDSLNPMRHAVVIIAALLLAPLGVLGASDIPSPTAKPNIVFIYADDFA